MWARLVSQRAPRVESARLARADGQLVADITLADLKAREEKLRKREAAVEARDGELSKEERKLGRREKDLGRRERKVEEQEQTAEQAVAEQRERLEAVAGLSQQEARELLMEEVGEDARRASVERVRAIEQEARELAEERARMVISAAIQRFASEPHKDTRAPQNLNPIGGLEYRLRHLLGDQYLMERALRTAAVGR